jgi:outer membrane receptor protein involved in Fe transport
VGVDLFCLSDDVRVDSTYQSAVYFTDLTYTAVPGQGGYSLFNARLTWESPGRDWSVAAFGTNLGNKFYYNGKLTLQKAVWRSRCFTPRSASRLRRSRIARAAAM